MIPLFKPAMSLDVLTALKPILTYDANGNMMIGQGNQVEKFEHAFAQFCNLPFIPLSVNSCTSAIELALQLIGIQQGDEIITTPITCTATNSPILLYGAKPIWSDVDKHTGLID